MRSRRHLALTAAVAVVAALTPTTSGAAGAAGVAGTDDLVEVQGTVRVMAGEDGHPDRYSVETRSGRLIPLADGLDVDPGAQFSGTLVVPGGQSGVLSRAGRTAALDRAARRPGGVDVRDVRTFNPRPAPGPTTHTTYLAKLTDLGGFTVPDADLVAQIGAAQQYWVRESGGLIPSWSTATGLTPTTSAAASVAGGCGLGANGAQFDAIWRDVAARVYPGVDFSGDSPNHLVIVVPNACYNQEAAGRARRGVSFANGGPVIVIERPGSSVQGTTEHEFGHNVGLQHSNNPRAEYGGLYELMGSDPSGYTSPTLGTVYRWEQGIVAGGEYADGTGGGTWALGSRAAASGLRSVVFIDPDTGKRVFVDYRDGGGVDASAFYTTGLSVPSYGQSYAKGVVIEQENEDRGSFLLDVPGGDGALQAGEAWSNQSGSMVVRATTANTVQVTRTPKPALPAGSASIAGTAQPFRPVSASGSVAGATSYRYQWLVNGAPVPQADEATFTPTLAMVGAALSVQVTGYAVGRDPSPTATSAPVTVPPATFYYRSGTKSRATIDGKARVGQVLTASGLDWVSDMGTTPPGLTLSYKWLRNGKLIKGARKSTYRLTFRDLKKRIQVKEYPSAPGFETGGFTRSDATRKVRIGKLASPRPKIGGKAKVGKRVKARTPGWTRGTKFRYQWFVGKKAIRGATGKKLRISRSLKGKKIAVKVTGAKKGFKKASAKSRATKVKK